ncbi:hypothetical protein [Pseudomonas rubra]|uniref:Uncharacterized protein n=1 Tax=Pseudomonas rubra TaxID=2942627 RepID=A0ABT5P8P4_9PSED|nr:hypothetical protein [Pseudomonas rubra]MDD1014557.1 hypothetical protein [Pseudomonas rubra]MDD1041525.1 hypothetical protein [Pseudomonas rubra]MDD1157955.1 hypothetical protein [Pseudomonas rubra]
MTTQDFDELAGRIEGIARSVMILAGTLQRQTLLDEQRLQADLRIAAQGLHPELTGRAAAVRTLEDLADQLLADYRYVKARERNPSQWRRKSR